MTNPSNDPQESAPDRLKRWLRQNNLTDDWLRWAIALGFLFGPLISRWMR